MNYLAGEGVGLVKEITPAGQIVRELAEEADQIIGRLQHIRS
jgi:NAD(P)H-dependent flavin oxidoreductase YrpB (nitropropane dioxygenase family)